MRSRLREKERKSEFFPLLFPLEKKKSLGASRQGHGTVREGQAQEAAVRRGERGRAAASREGAKKEIKNSQTLSLTVHLVQRRDSHRGPRPGRAPADSHFGPARAGLGCRFRHCRRAVSSCCSSRSEEASQTPVRSCCAGGVSASASAPPTKRLHRCRGRRLPRGAQQLPVIARIVAAPALPFESGAAGLHRRGAAAAPVPQEALGDALGAREAAGAALDAVEPRAQLVVSLGDLRVF